MLLHCKRIAFVLNIVSNATESELPKRDLKENGWKVVDENGRQMVSVVWDTMQTKNSIDSVKRVILRKYGCKKHRCRTNACSCRRYNSNFCTGLCECQNFTNISSKDSLTEMEEISIDEDSATMKMLTKLIVVLHTRKTMNFQIMRRRKTLINDADDIDDEEGRLFYADNWV